MPNITVQKKGAGSELALSQALATLSKTDVLVGISENTANRPKGQINNAELLFIMTHGVNAREMRQGIRGILKDEGFVDYWAWRMGASSKGLNKLPLGTKEYYQARQLYIMSKGSPAQAIPPRPVIEPAIEAPDNKQQITQELENAAAAMIDQDPVKAKQSLRAAGMAAVTASKKWFTDPRNRWAPNAPSTIKAKGSSRPMINLGELRKAIVYVPRETT